jgi:hypothetical protein
MRLALKILYLVVAIVVLWYFGTKLLDTSRPGFSGTPQQENYRGYRRPKRELRADHTDDRAPRKQSAAASTAGRAARPV